MALAARRSSGGPPVIYSSPRVIASTGALLASIAVTTAGARQQQTTFRGSADAVVVDVTVLANGAPRAGLVKGDFALFDNGVRQDVELVSDHTVPLDVSLVVDAGWRVTDEVRGVTTDERRFSASVRTIGDHLRPGDRLGLVRFRSEIREDLPLSPIPVNVLTRPIPAFWSALNDALAQAMIRPSPPGRRHVIAVFTDGIDVGSVLRPTEVKDLAAQCDASVYVVLDRHRSGRGMLASSGNPVVVQMLKDVATTTGGDVLSESDIQAAFTKLLSLAQHSYVLTYVPQGVVKGGWHTLTVNVTKSGTFSVQARRGYVWR